MCPDHLEVKVVGNAAVSVLLSEVGLKVPENVGVRGLTNTIRLAPRCLEIVRDSHSYRGNRDFTVAEARLALRV